MASYFIQKLNDELDNTVIVAPDLGSVGRARTFSLKCNCSLAMIDKRRPKANVSQVCNIIGEVKGKTCILVDDIIDTAGTICNAAKALLEIGGAKKVYACATHAVLSGNAINNFKNTPFEEVVLLDTIPLPADKQLPNFKVLSTAQIFAEAIERIYEELPVSTISVL